MYELIQITYVDNKQTNKQISKHNGDMFFSLKFY